MKIVTQYFLRSGVFFIYLENSTFLDLGFIANFNQHKIQAVTIATRPKKNCSHIFSKTLNF